MLNALLPFLILGATAGQIDYETITFTSTHDQSEQPARYYAAPKPEPQPLLVVVHWWSADIDSYNPDGWVNAARAYGWHVAVPNFRGGNFSPEACASPAARQDILDTVDTIIERYDVDTTRIYLAGNSGGGHMSMIMAGYYPERWTAVSAWSGISNLGVWHQQMKSMGLKYYEDVEACVGGAPGSSPQVDEQIKARSPLYFIANAASLPLDLNAGVHDGHIGSGSVPIHHTLDAFNAVAKAQGAEGVPQSTINALSQEIVPPTAPVVDESYGRRIHLRESVGKARVTIFEGGHEELIEAACAWLSTHQGRTP